MYYTVNRKCFKLAGMPSPPLQKRREEDNHTINDNPPKTSASLQMLFEYANKDSEHAI